LQGSEPLNKVTGQTLRSQLGLAFDLAGVVGTMTPAQPLENDLGAAQMDTLAIVRKGLTEWPGDRHIFKRDIQELADIRNVAGQRIAYTGKAAQMFRQFGAELSDRIKFGIPSDVEDAR
jgi:hypothetical protein